MPIVSVPGTEHVSASVSGEAFRAYDRSQFVGRPGGWRRFVCPLPARAEPRCRTSCLQAPRLRQWRQPVSPSTPVLRSRAARRRSSMTGFTAGCSCSRPASCAFRGRARRRRGPPGSFAAIGVCLWGSAEIVFRLSMSDPDAWYPRSTQVLLFVAFAFAYTTLVLLARERVRRFDTVLALDGVLAGLAAAAVAAVAAVPRARRAPRPGPPRRRDVPPRGARRADRSWSPSWA